MSNYKFNYEFLREDYKKEVIEKYQVEMKKVEIAISVWTAAAATLKAEKNQTKKFTKREIKKIEANCSHKIRIYFSKGYYNTLDFLTLCEAGYNDDTYKYDDIQNHIYCSDDDSVESVVAHIENKINELEERKQIIDASVEKINSSDIITLHNEKMKEVDKLIKEANELKKLLKLEY